MMVYHRYHYVMVYDHINIISHDDIPSHYDDIPSHDGISFLSSCDGISSRINIISHNDDIPLNYSA